MVNLGFRRNVASVAMCLYFSRISIPLSAQMLTFLCVFLGMVTYHGRLVEVTSRLDFLWKQQAERELSDMIESRHNNMQLLKNILPDRSCGSSFSDAGEST